MTGTAIAPVSVVIPAYNASRYLGPAIESVLAQTVAPAEVVVVDDGSTDDTAAVGARYPGVTVLTQANAGAGVARNHGVAATTAPLVAFLDADDLWLPNKLERQLEELADPTVEAVFGLAQNFLSPDRAEELSTLRIDTTVRRGFLVSALLVRRSTLAAVGPFAVEGTLTDWVDWYFRLSEGGHRCVVVDELVFMRRVHGDNATLTEPGANSAYLRLLKSSLDRRRSPATTPAPSGGTP